MHTLLLDNYDSYTYNLYQRILVVNGDESRVTVIRNDEMDWPTLYGRIDLYDNIVIGPGPGVPSEPRDFGLCASLLRWAAGLDQAPDGEPAKRVPPILGVCLGHQGLAWILGGQVVRAPRVAHGMLTPLAHNGRGLFEGIPNGMRAVRYHSWIVDNAALPECIEVTARTDDADAFIMGLAHRSRPLFGLQFHPESVCTEYGDLLLANFATMTRALMSPLAICAAPEPAADAAPPTEPTHRAVWRRLPDGRYPADPTVAFAHLFGSAKRSFWLDSSRTGGPYGGRFSYMGAAASKGLAAIAYNRASGEVREWIDNADEPAVRPVGPDGFLGDLQSLTAARRCAPDPLLPCGLCGGGLVGYLGYEMRSECTPCLDVPQARPGEPDSAFLIVDRFVALDHAHGHVYAVALVPVADDAHDDAGAWFDSVANALEQLPPSAPNELGDAIRDPLFYLGRDRSTYLGDIGACLDEIANGESYELCLTNKVIGPKGTVRDPLAFYGALRTKNPAPYAALLRLGGDLPTVASASPELFLSVSAQGRVRSKPIKGTVRRGTSREEDALLVQQLKECPKTFAENLMIVDLVRNDLGACCERGSVVVPNGLLMAIETYATVHQMVTTVEGQLPIHCGNVTALDCVKRAFPPGSMTGAPKLRSTEILNRLERNRPRGIYSGALGYFSADGSCCLSVVIRTAVIDPDGSVTIGCGGAIVADSDPDQEFQEILLKADRLVRVAGSRKPIGGATPPERILLETLRLEPNGTFFLEHVHVDRLARSAMVLQDMETVGEQVIRIAVQGALGDARFHHQGACMRVRILYDLHTRECSWTATPLADTEFYDTPAKALSARGQRARVRVSPVRVRSNDPALCHKTTARAIYERAHAQAWTREAAVDGETLLVNENGEVTETVRGSVALLLPGTSVPTTPALACGLLPGTLRQHLLAQGLLVEGVITLRDVHGAAESGAPLLLMNSVRGVYCGALAP